MQSVARSVKARARNALERQGLGVTIARLDRKASPLQGSDSPLDEAQADLPLRDDLPVEADGAPPVTPVPSRAHATLLVDPPPAAAGGGGLRTWFVAAAALIVGIVFGFYSGYSVATRTTGAAGPAPEPAQATAPAPGRTFTEAGVAEPVRVDPAPIVPEGAAPPGPSAPAPVVAPPPAPVRRAPPVEREAPIDRVASGPGSLQIVSRPAGAEVLVDGRTVGRTPLVVGDVRPGSHSVRLELPGFRRWATSVDVEPGQRTRVAASLEQ